MKRLGPIVFWITVLSASPASAQLEGGYSALRPQLAEQRPAWAGSDAPEPLKETILQQIDHLLNLLALGEDAEDLGIDDEIVRQEAELLLRLLFRASSNYALSQEAYSIRSDLEDIASEVFSVAESAFLLAQPPGALNQGFLRLFNPLNPLATHCSIQLAVTRSNPDSAPRFATFVVSAVAAPSGGTFTETITGHRVTLPESPPDPVNLFANAPVYENKSTTSTSLPVQTLAVETPFDQAPDLNISRQVWKGIRLSGGVPPGNGWQISIKVDYVAPSGATCSASRIIYLDDTGTEDISAYSDGAG